MTIIQPIRNRFYLTLIIIILGTMAAACLTWWLVIYNSAVDSKHNIGLLEQKIQDQEVQNTELKNRVFSMLDSQKLEALLQSKGYVKDKGPQYFEATMTFSWASDPR
jgi:cell division protein FtsL